MWKARAGNGTVSYTHLYPHLNVKIGATHAGISVGEDGATHQCLEDLSLMREIPGMVVINPSDDVEARAAVKAAYDHVGPVYPVSYTHLDVYKRQAHE